MSVNIKQSNLNFIWGLKITFLVNKCKVFHNPWKHSFNLSLILHSYRPKLLPTWYHSWHSIYGNWIQIIPNIWNFHILINIEIFKTLKSILRIAINSISWRSWPVSRHMTIFLYFWNTWRNTIIQSWYQR